MHRFKVLFEHDVTYRRFNLEEPGEGVTLFKKLRAKISDICFVQNGLPASCEPAIYWKDAKGTKIICESEDDLRIAIDEVPSASSLGIIDLMVDTLLLRLPDNVPPRQTKVPPHRERRSCVCETCGRGFKCRSHLLDHVRIHTGEKPFQCDICGNAYRHRSSLRGHMNSHSGEKPHKCTFPGCKYESRWSSYMAEHMRQMHGRRTAASEEREFVRNNRPKKPITEAIKRKRQGRRKKIVLEESAMVSREEDELPTSTTLTLSMVDGVPTAATLSTKVTARPKPVFRRPRATGRVSVAPRSAKSRRRKGVPVSMSGPEDLSEDMHPGAGNVCHPVMEFVQPSLPVSESDDVE